MDSKNGWDAMLSDDEIISFLYANIKNQKSLRNFLQQLDRLIPFAIVDLRDSEGRNILHIIIWYDVSTWELLLNKLDQQTIDTLMLIPDAKGHTPFYDLIVVRCLFSKGLILNKFLPHISDEVMGRLLSAPKAGATMLEYIFFDNSFHDDVLKMIIAKTDTVLLQRIMSSRADYPEYVSKNLYYPFVYTNYSNLACRNPTVYNRVRTKTGFNSGATIATWELCELTVENLTRYILLNPKLSIYALKHVAISITLFNRAYIQGYFARLHSAYNELSYQICLVQILQKRFVSSRIVKELIDFLVGTELSPYIIEREVSSSYDEYERDFICSSPNADNLYFYQGPSASSILDYIKNNIDSGEYLSKYLRKLKGLIPVDIENIQFSKNGNIFHAFLKNNLSISIATWQIVFKKLAQDTIDHLMLMDNADNENPFLMLLKIQRNMNDLRLIDADECCRFRIITKACQLFEEKRHAICNEFVEHISDKALNEILILRIYQDTILEYLIFNKKFPDDILKSILSRTNKIILADIMLKPKNDLEILCISCMRNPVGEGGFYNLSLLGYRRPTLYNFIKELLGFKILADYCIPLNWIDIYKANVLKRQSLNTFIIQIRMLQTLSRLLERQLTKPLAKLIIYLFMDEEHAADIRNVADANLARENNSFITNAPTVPLLKELRRETSQLENLLDYSSDQDIAQLTPMAIIFESFRKSQKPLLTLSYTAVDCKGPLTECMKNEKQHRV